MLANTNADVADARFVTADLGTGPELAVLVRSAGLGAAADLRDELLAAVGSDARCPVVIVAEDAMIPDAMTSRADTAILVAPDQPGVYRWVPAGHPDRSRPGRGAGRGARKDTGEHVRQLS